MVVACIACSKSEGSAVGERVIAWNYDTAGDNDLGMVKLPGGDRTRKSERLAFQLPSGTLELDVDVSLAGSPKAVPANAVVKVASNAAGAKVALQRCRGPRYAERSGGELRVVCELHITHGRAVELAWLSFSDAQIVNGVGAPPQ